MMVSQPQKIAEASGTIKLASEAVVMFFVLSGYLVGGSVLRSVQVGRWSWRTYLTKRITRLWMALIPALVCGALLDQIGLRHFGQGSVYTSPHGIALVTTLNLTNRLSPATWLGNALFLQTILVPMYGTNVSLWSLANEFWYYIAFPFCVLCVTSKSSWKTRCLYGAAAVATLVFCGKHIVMLFPLWIFGAVVAHIPRKLSSSQSRKLSLPSALIMFFCMFAVRILNMQTLLAEYIVGCVASMVLWVVVQQTAPSKGRYYRGIANFFSNISYSLYLFHLPIAVFLCAVIDSPWHQFDKTPKNIAIFAGSDFVILFCVYVLWKLFESRTDNVRRAVFEREQTL